MQPHKTPDDRKVQGQANEVLVLENVGYRNGSQCLLRLFVPLPLCSPSYPSSLHSYLRLCRRPAVPGTKRQNIRPPLRNRVL